MNFSQLSKILAIYFVASFFPARAAFEDVPHPRGWVANPSGGGLYGGTGSNGGKPFFQANANWYKYISDVKTAGGSVKIPWYMRMSTSSGAYFAARAFTPAGLGFLALPFVVEWLSGNGISLIDGVWKVPTTPSNLTAFYNGVHFSSTPEGVCLSIQAAGFGGQTFTNYTTQGASGTTAGYCNFSGGSFAAVRKCAGINTYWNGAGCVLAESTMQPLTEEGFVERVAPLPIPIDLPEKLPFPLPVDDPVMNPNPSPTGAPEPVVSPDGLPYPKPAPRPSPDPFPFSEPSTKITQNPNKPWSVDKKPVEKDKATSTPSPKQTTEPTATSSPDTVSTTTPPKDPGLCAMFPDILACEKLGEAPEAPELPDKQIDVSITPISFGGAGSCPADRQVNITFINRNVPITYSYVCQLATGTKPVILALAWLSAALIVLGMGRKS